MLASTVRSVAGAGRRSMSALSSLLSAKADDMPSRAAIVFDQGGEKKRWNLGELERHSSATANGFAEMGLVHGDIVTAWLNNTVESVVVQLACAKAGVVLHSVAPDASPEVVRAAAKEAKCFVFDPSLEAESLRDQVRTVAQNNGDDVAGTYEQDAVGTKRYYAPSSWVSQAIASENPTDALGFETGEAAPHVVSVGWERIQGMHNLRHVYVYGPDPVFPYDTSAPDAAKLATHFDASGAAGKTSTHKDALAAGDAFAKATKLSSTDVVSVSSAAEGISPAVIAALQNSATVVIGSGEDEGVTVDGATAQRL